MWTYAVGLSDDYNYPQFNCPCAKHPGPDPPTYVGSHYYCESGKNGAQGYALYTNDPLWDGLGCPSENNCYIMMLECHGSSVNFLQLQLETY